MQYVLPSIVQYVLPSIGLLAFLLFLTATLVDGRRHPSWQHRAEALLGISGTFFLCWSWCTTTPELHCIWIRFAWSEHSWQEHR